MTAQWLVLKFGGTSVSGLPQWETIATLARQRLDDGYRVLLVCSAVSGVTEKLRALAETAGNHNVNDVTAVLACHRQLSKDLGVDVKDLLAEAEDEIIRLLAKLAAAHDRASRFAAIASLLAVGEWLSTRIGERFLARSLSVEWVDACDVLCTLPEADPSGSRAWLSARCKSGPDKGLQTDWSGKAPVLIIQGFIASHPTGSTALLGRGGSDTSAVLLASRLEAHRVEIWTDVPGLFSADPQVIPAARLLRTLDYEEALEMAASGAKVVHSRGIRAAAEVKLPIFVRDAARIDSGGTTIQSNGGSSSTGIEGIRSVCCQPDMAVLLLKNLDTREQVGFLAWVFAHISAAGISIDLVATSETTTTVAINRSSNYLDDTLLAKLAETLEQRCDVTVYPQCSGINLVGRGARVALADIDPGAEFFDGHPLLMLSASANDLCISLLVQSVDAEKLLNKLHNAVLGKRLDPKQYAKVFGPPWQDLK